MAVEPQLAQSTNASFNMSLSLEPSDKPETSELTKRKAEHGLVYIMYMCFVRRMGCVRHLGRCLEDRGRTSGLRVWTRLLVCIQPVFSSCNLSLTVIFSPLRQCWWNIVTIRTGGNLVHRIAVCARSWVCAALHWFFISMWHEPWQKSVFLVFPVGNGAYKWSLGDAFIQLVKWTRRLLNHYHSTYYTYIAFRYSLRR